MIPAVDKDRMEAIIDVCALNLESSGRKFIRLLDILIEETRKLNDTVEKDGLQRNQGKIAGWVQLRDYITRGFPNPRQQKQQNT